MNHHPVTQSRPAAPLPRRAFAGRSAALALAAGLTLLCLNGCVSSDSAALSWGSGSIQELHLLVLPVTLKSSQAGATDGFAVRVFASDRRRAKGIPIRSGTLEILGYEGSPYETNPRNMTPAQIWSYPAASLPPFAISTSLGTGYDLALPWQGQRPTNNRLTLVARHTPASGAALLSAPSVIPNGLK